MIITTSGIYPKAWVASVQGLSGAVSEQGEGYLFGETAENNVMTKQLLMLEGMPFTRNQAFGY